MITETKIRQIEPDIAVIEVSGRMHLGNMLLSLESSIRSTIDQGVRKIIVDVSTLTYIDSAGVGTLVSCKGYMGQHNGQFRVAGAHDAVARTFKLVHLGMIVPLDADVESSRRHLSSEGGATATM